EIIGDMAHESRGLQHRVERDRRAASVLRRAMEMVLQVLADAGKVMDRPDAVPADLVCWADARQEKQLRGIDSAAGQNDLPARPDFMPLLLLCVLNSDRAPPLQNNPGGLRLRNHGE